MKIAITGHTSGIGKYLFDNLSADHTVVGYSRSNGYDLSLDYIRKKVIEETKDVNVFINNAFDLTGQSEDFQYKMLQEFYEAHYDKDEILKIFPDKDYNKPFLIHMGSMIENLPAEFIVNPNMLDYKKCKDAQGLYCKNRKIFNLKAGMFDTEGLRKIAPHLSEYYNNIGNLDTLYQIVLLAIKIFYGNDKTFVYSVEIG